MTDTLKIESDGFNITTVTHAETGLRFKSLADYDAFMAKRQVLPENAKRAEAVDSRERVMADEALDQAAADVDAQQALAFQAIVDEAHSMAVSKGWHDVAWAALPTKAARADRIGSLLALVHSEVSEALEAYRARELEAWTREDGKPEGVAAELADVVIRVADLAGYLGIDLGAAIRGKMDFNATRPHRHGGKAL